MMAYFQNTDFDTSVTASEITMLMAFLMVDQQLPSECISQVSHFLDTEFDGKPFASC